MTSQAYSRQLFDSCPDRSTIMKAKKTLILTFQYLRNASSYSLKPEASVET